MNKRSNMAQLYTKKKISVGNKSDMYAVKPNVNKAGERDFEYFLLSSPYLSYKRVKNIANSDPMCQIGVNVYQLLNQFNKICKNEEKEGQLEIVHSCLLKHKQSKNPGNPYMFMPATEAVACFEGKVKRMPIITFKRSTEA